MLYNFDEVINRYHTDSVKYDKRKAIFGTEDVLPMWVADMDIATPDFIIEAIKKRLEQRIFGYFLKPEGFYESIANWMLKRHQWNVNPESIVYSPGVVTSLNLIILGYTEPGEEIIVQPPVYFPFFETIKINNRNVIYNPLVLKNGRYIMNLDDLRKKITAKTKAIFISNPHNPGGVVWEKKELLELASICLENKIIMVSDEIHADIIFPGYKHIPLASLSEEIATQTITLNAPSKTFNTAGLAASYAIITSSKLRNTFKKMLERTELSMGNILGITALQAAYEQGDEWLSQILKYLNNNLIYFLENLSDNSFITPIKPEATYLIWLDCKKMNLNEVDLRRFFIEKIKIGTNPGIMFGEGGEGFQRINIACPLIIVKEAIKRIENEIKLSFH